VRSYLAVFASVLLAELGDKTQLATLLFAANPAIRAWGVFLAAAAALVLSTAVAVVAGARLGSWISPGHLKLAAGVGFIAIGIWVLLDRA
jgi:putative Ca2+/H+ antiporter (TMEM165/GDT1 family)